MPDPIFACETHSYYQGEGCPVCDRVGREVLDGSRRRQLSKFVSGALRHFPDDAGIELDEAGWTPLAALVGAVEDNYDWASRDHVEGVVATDPKGRFELDEAGGEQRIRAAYGHSVPVDLASAPTPVPETLYHGTAPRHVDAIMSEGLRPMSRQKVHLSESVEEAQAVGARHAEDPVVLVVDAAAMRAEGHDIVKRGSATYTTDRVPPRYVSRRSL
ncbi:RNA 2'-phosphotransferase [Haloarcula halophila]|uniref:RNA 2'-phosphotransferase n=1 Tax=Haloarcula TaxID=2237 RepID=UPI0023E3A562|nr:RNA 2'-phosphotransferase [Halomicroarcula sp. DFY41]